MKTDKNILIAFMLNLGFSIFEIVISKVKNKYFLNGRSWSDNNIKTYIFYL